jgi:spore photoproduct lyase
LDEPLKMKITFKAYRGLDGKESEGVCRVSNGSIICRFEKTPYPEKENDLVCPHFLELKWANGCYFDCAWCYLNGTYRFHSEWKQGKPNIKDYKVIEKHLKTFLINNSTTPELLNSGELSDSLLIEHTSNPFTTFIARILEKYDEKRIHKVLILTKSTEIKHLLELNMPWISYERSNFQYSFRFDFSKNVHQNPGPFLDQ